MRFKNTSTIPVTYVLLIVSWIISLFALAIGIYLLYFCPITMTNLALGIGVIIGGIIVAAVLRAVGDIVQMFFDLINYVHSHLKSRLDQGVLQLQMLENSLKVEVRKFREEIKEASSNIQFRIGNVAQSIAHYQKITLDTLNQFEQGNKQGLFSIQSQLRQLNNKEEQTIEIVKSFKDSIKEYQDEGFGRIYEFIAAINKNILDSSAKQCHEIMILQDITSTQVEVLRAVAKNINHLTESQTGQIDTLKEMLKKQFLSFCELFESFTARWHTVFKEDCQLLRELVEEHFIANQKLTVEERKLVSVQLEAIMNEAKRINTFLDKYITRDEISLHLEGILNDVQKINLSIDTYRSQIYPIMEQITRSCATIEDRSFLNRFEELFERNGTTFQKVNENIEQIKILFDVIKQHLKL